MLNKNQSNKRNSWKYAIVIPALVAFVFLFQIEVIAQEKNQIQNDKLMNVNYEINSFSTDKEIASDIKSLEKDFEINCSIAGIERNKESQITSISIILIDKNDKKQEFNIKGSQPIKPIKFFCYFNEEGQTEIGFYGKDGALVKNSTQNNDIAENTEIFINGKKVTQKELDSTNPNAIKEMDVIKKNNTSTIKIITKKNADDNVNLFDPTIQATDLGLENVDPIGLNILQKPKNPYTITKKTTETNGIPGDAEYFIDGKKVSPLEAESMNPNHISSVNVQKEGASTKNAIRIITKSYLNGKEMIPEPPTPPAAPTFKSKAPKVDPDKKDNQGWGISFETSAPEDNITRIQNDKNVDYKKAIIIINGKISDYKSLDKLKPEDIFSVGVQKPSNGPESTKQNALKKYGEKAINGIIEIETKDFLKK